MRETKLKEILANVDSFPAMPDAGTKLLVLLEEPDTAVSEIEEILRYDPGLTANVLKLANSAYFGIPSKIGSLKQAVILLGLKRLIQLVVASCVSAVIDRLGIQLDQFEAISAKVARWVDELSGAQAFN